MKTAQNAWRWCAVAVAVAAAAMLFTPRSSAQRAAAATFTIERLTSPAGADSMAPQLIVSADRMILSWLETGDLPTLKYAERTPSGWSAATTVASNDHIIANWADVPSVHALGDGRLIAQWLEENGPDTEAYDLRLSMSKDRGRTWTALRSPHGDRTKTQHGFPSFFESGPTGFGIVWLDGRETAKAGGAMTLRSTLYESPGAGVETLVAPRVCDCCPTAAATTSEGAIVAFRNRTVAEIRDIYITRWNGRAWSAPAPVYNDGWKINACPVNGPALAARGGDVAIAWFTAAGGVGRAMVAFSSDAGRTFGKPVRVDDEGSTGAVQVVMMNDGAVAVSWIELAKGVTQLRVRRVTTQGDKSPAVTIAGGMGRQLTRMAAASDEIVFAWVEDSRGSSWVRTARAKM